MNKVLLIIQREFLSRVQKKSFLLATLLVPLLFPAIIGGMAYFAYQQDKNADLRVVEIIDESGLFTWENTSKYEYLTLDIPLEQAKTAYNESEHFALIYIPAMEIESPAGINFYSKNSPGVSLISEFERKIERQIHDIKLKKSGISQEVLDNLRSDVNIESFNIEDGEEKKSDSTALFAVGYLMGFLIYIFLFAYGSQVMQGVIEEKSSKIIEIIVSTVKPFHLMMGKVIGVASVGLVQFTIWILLSTAIFSAAGAYFGSNMPQDIIVEQAMGEMPDVEGVAELKSITMDNKVQKIMDKFSDIPITKIVLLFIFYFLGGYLLYGALFAAVGSAVDNAADAQQFMLPIMLPIIVGLMGLFMFVFEDPHSSISFWLSIIPLTSPIVMMGRIGFGVPWWEVALSMTLLVAGFTFTVWMAGRIYRVGILMHGVKVNYKVLAKWFMMKN
jgi:ABC-2 type transport system permease protein